MPQPQRLGSQQGRGQLPVSRRQLPAGEGGQGRLGSIGNGYIGGAPDTVGARPTVAGAGGGREDE